MTVIAIEIWVCTVGSKSDEGLKIVIGLQFSSEGLTEGLND